MQVEISTVAVHRESVKIEATKSWHPFEKAGEIGKVALYGRRMWALLISEIRKRRADEGRTPLVRL